MMNPKVHKMLSLQTLGIHHPFTSSDVQAQLSLKAAAWDPPGEAHGLMRPGLSQSHQKGLGWAQPGPGLPELSRENLPMLLLFNANMAGTTQILERNH